MRRELELDAEGTVLRGWHYVPDASQGPVPTIVMAHGFSAVKEQYLDEYAAAFAAAGLGAVVGEISGNPAALDFTASKRLTLRAEASGVPLWLIRSHDAQGLSAARERWRVGASPSMRHPHDPGAPGAPRW